MLRSPESEDGEGQGDRAAGEGLEVPSILGGPEGLPTAGRTALSRREALSPVGCFRRSHEAQGVGIAPECMVLPSQGCLD